MQRNKVKVSIVVIALLSLISLSDQVLDQEVTLAFENEGMIHKIDIIQPLSQQQQQQEQIIEKVSRENSQELEKYYCKRKQVHTSTKLIPKKDKRQKLVETIYDFNMYVDSMDKSVSTKIAQQGTWQPQNINLIGHIVKPGMNILNLGSQSGLEAIVMGKIIGNKGKLFIFQPYSFSNMLVTKNIKLNKLSEITNIYKYGASNKKQTSNIQVSYSNTGGSQIKQKSDNNDNNKNINKLYNEIEEVQLEKVDNILPTNLILDFALIDVEKMEIDALEGMRKILQRSKERLVMMIEWQFVWHMMYNQERVVSILDYLVEELGYRIYTYRGAADRYCRVGEFTEIKGYQKIFKKRYVDLFFFPSDMKPPGKVISAQKP